MDFYVFIVICCFCFQGSNTSLSSIRQLREISSQGCIVAQNHLLSAYGKGHYGGLEEQQIVRSVRSFIQSSQPTNAHHVFNVQTALTSSMRWDLLPGIILTLTPTFIISWCTSCTCIHVQTNIFNKLALWTVCHNVSYDCPEGHS